MNTTAAVSPSPVVAIPAEGVLTTKGLPYTTQAIDGALDEATDSGRKWCTSYAVICRSQHSGVTFIDDATVSTTPERARGRYRDVAGFELVRVAQVAVIEIAEES